MGRIYTKNNAIESARRRSRLRYRHNFSLPQLVLIIFCYYNLIAEAAGLPAGLPNDAPSKCGVYSDYGKNDLSLIDVVVKNADTNIACIKARFSLAIKVEEAVPIELGDELGETMFNSGYSNSSHAATHKRIVLGYLPLDDVLSVEDTCPGKQQPSEATTTTPAPSLSSETMTQASEMRAPEPPPQKLDELEMIVIFKCGKLGFTFSRNETSTYLTSIKGIVQIDSRVTRCFINERTMFATSDLEHHFKYDDLIEVTSESQTSAYILTANFYFTEIETFRETTNRDYVRPPDEQSRPFVD